MNEEDLKAIPESIRDWDEVKNSDTPEVFWDRISNMRSKFGTGLFKPGEDAGDEDWNKFAQKAIELSGNRLLPANLDDEEQRNIVFKTLGRPEDPNGYEFAEIEDAPELSEDRKKFLGEVAFKANLTKSQMKALDEAVRGADVAAMKEQLHLLSEAEKELKQEWGMAFNDRKHQAEKAAKIFFPHLGETPQLSPAEIKSFYSIAKQLGQSKEFKEQGQQGNDFMSPSEAAAKIAEIRGNKDHPYFDVRAPGHADAKRRMSELYKIKNNLQA